MKRFKNTYVGTSTDFAGLTTNGASDTRVPSGVNIMVGSNFIDEDSGTIYKLVIMNDVKFWVRIDNKAATGYDS